MSARLVFGFVAVLSTGCATVPSPPPTTCIDFEAPLVPSTTYGSPQLPGTVVLTAGPIDMSVETFQQVTGTSVFDRAIVSSPIVGVGANQTLQVSGIGLRFAMAHVMGEVTLEYVDKGGYENFSMNGSPIRIGKLATLLSSFGTVNAAVSQVDVRDASGTVVGRKGTLKLQGQITEFLIGGQELWVDKVCAQTLVLKTL
jgi:hypothetical protein